MIYRQTYTIKWHDTDAKRMVRPSAIVAYMQETANLQCEHHGTPLDALRDEKQLGFILSRLSVKLYRPLYAYEQIEVQTWICDSRGFSFNRCFRIVRGDEVIAEAFTVWALLNIATREFVRVEDFQYGFEGEPPLETALPLRLRIPKELTPEEAGRRTIAYSDIDYNMHMNNTRYPDMLCDFIDDIRDRRVTDVIISYLHESALGDTLTVHRTKDGDTFYFRTVNAAGTVCQEAMIVTEALS